MDRAQRREGDTLADELISQYWCDFEFGSTWNYYAYPARYVARDSWATDKKWLEMAQRFLERDTNHWTAFEILLGQGLIEYVPRAQEEARIWLNETGGHDAYYLFDTLKYFPAEDPVRQAFLGQPPSVLDERQHDRDGSLSLARSALISVRDESMCQYLAARIYDLLEPPQLDEDDFLDNALVRMVELGPLCRELLPETLIETAQIKVYDALEKDRETLTRHHRGSIPLEGERNHWIRGDIGYYAWKLQWEEMLLDLRRTKWYWTSQFDPWFMDADNHCLMAWSLRESDAVLKKRALNVMVTHPYQRIDGAIAWKRMHPGT